LPGCLRHANWPQAVADPRKSGWSRCRYGVGRADYFPSRARTAHRAPPNAPGCTTVRWGIGTVLGRDVEHHVGLVAPTVAGRSGGHDDAGRSVSSSVRGGDGRVRSEATSIAGHRALRALNGLHELGEDLEAQRRARPTRPPRFLGRPRMRRHEPACAARAGRCLLLATGVYYLATAGNSAYRR
jgi:hypothetical protein